MTKVELAWEIAKKDIQFIKTLQAKLEVTWIGMEEWHLIEIEYKNTIVELDVFSHFETSTFQVYPTFLGQTITELQVTIPWGNHYE